MSPSVLFRQSLSRALESSCHAHIVAEVNSCREILTRLKRDDVQIILLDEETIKTPVWKMIDHIKSQYRCKFMLLSESLSEKSTVLLIRKGICGFVSKESNFNILIEAIQEVVQRGCFFSVEMGRKVMKAIAEDPAAGTMQTPQLLNLEELILIRICQEENDKAIAMESGNSLRTIQRYRNCLYSKTGTKTDVGLAFFAIKHGYFPAPDDVFIDS